MWFHAPDAQQIHDSLADDGVAIVTEPFDGPFGRSLRLPIRTGTR